MHSSNDRNSDIDDISVNTNLKVFNGGLGLVINQKREPNCNQQKKNEINKQRISSKEFQGTKDKNFSENNNNNNPNIANNNNNNLNSKFKENNLDKNNLIEAEGIISFRSKKVDKKENDEAKTDLNVITNGILNKMHLRSTKKDARNILSNTLNNSSANEEQTINKIFKLNNERVIEKEIKNFEKESQRIQSRILAGNPLDSSSSQFSEEDEVNERFEGFNTQKIKRTLDVINIKNLNKNGKFNKSGVNNFSENRPINNYNKNYNTIEGDERINLSNNFFDDSGNLSILQDDCAEVNEKNIFWNLRDNNNNNYNEDFERINDNFPLKRSKSAIDREFNTGKFFLHF
jgi:hypothetical protein